MRKPYRLMLLLLLGTTASLCAVRLWPKADARVLPDSAVNEAETYSNILPEDYVGPNACIECHKGKHSLWSASAHSRMNQLPTKQSVQGDFANATLELPTGTVAFTTEGDSFFMTVTKAGQQLRRYRVTRTVGSRSLQYYIGVQTSGPEPADSKLYGEHMLPFAYIIDSKQWLPKHFLDPDGPEDLHDGTPHTEGIDKIKDIRPYSKVCLNCHNTMAYAFRIYQRPLVGFSDAVVAATIGPLSEALSTTIPVGRTVADFEKLNARLDPEKHLVTLGISCESCHFGCREHVANKADVRFLPTSKFLKVIPKRADRPIADSRSNAPAINGICTQCHAGGGMLFPNGGAQCNSREGLDAASGACMSQMSCVSCHEPHTSGPRAGGPDNPKHVAACLECHQQYGNPENARAHSRHSARGANCLDCHMPRQTLGVDTLVRTHRVSQPVEVSMISANAANSCNLCHLDKSLRWTLDELDKGWGKKHAPAVGSPALAVMDRPMGQVWLKGKGASMRAVAAQSYARSPQGKAMLPDLFRALNDEEPMNRVFIRQAVERVLDRKLTRAEYEVTASPVKRLEQIERLLRLP